MTEPGLSGWCRPWDQAWERRQPYTLTEDAQLESVPGHYEYLLGIAG